jgi:6-phosphogluconate dehydrogenase
VQRLGLLFSALAPGVDAPARLSGRNGGAASAEEGSLHCGSHGAGHFVERVHNGIEYGVIAAYADELNLLRNANAGKRASASDPETSPLRNPELHQFDMNLTDITEVRHRGSVIGSWLLDLTADRLRKGLQLEAFGDYVEQDRAVAP